MTQVDDAHCHLADAQLHDRLDVVMRRAGEAGVRRIITCATSPADWDITLDIADRFPCVIPAVGVHPWFLRDLPPDWLVRLDALLAAHPSALVGEIGLDSPRGASDALAQQMMSSQIGLAAKHKRPFVVHSVRAWEPLLEVLRETDWATPFMIHAYSGSAEMTEQLAELGAWFSFGGALTNPRAGRVHAALRAAPSDRLLLETDAPDFLPFGFVPADAPNEPANLPINLLAAAVILQQSPDALAELLSRNFECFRNG